MKSKYAWIRKAQRCLRGLSERQRPGFSGG